MPRGMHSTISYGMHSALSHDVNSALSYDVNSALSHGVPPAMLSRIVIAKASSSRSGYFAQKFRMEFHTEIQHRYPNGFNITLKPSLGRTL